MFQVIFSLRTVENHEDSFLPASWYLLIVLVVVTFWSSQLHNGLIPSLSLKSMQFLD